MHVDELTLHRRRLRMKPAVLDPHLAHAPTRKLLAMNLHRNGKMLGERVALFVNGRRRDLLRFPLPTRVRVRVRVERSGCSRVIWRQSAVRLPRFTLTPTLSLPGRGSTLQ